MDKLMQFCSGSQKWNSQVWASSHEGHHPCSGTLKTLFPPFHSSALTPSLSLHPESPEWLVSFEGGPPGHRLSPAVGRFGCSAHKAWPDAGRTLPCPSLGEEAQQAALQLVDGSALTEHLPTAGCMSWKSVNIWWGEGKAEKLFS